MANTNQIDNEVILKEILPLPAEKIIHDRFAATEEEKAADCSGRCSSGVCRTFV